MQGGLLACPFAGPVCPTQGPLLYPPSLGPSLCRPPVCGPFPCGLLWACPCDPLPCVGPLCVCPCAGHTGAFSGPPFLPCPSLCYPPHRAPYIGGYLHTRMPYVYCYCMCTIVLYVYAHGVCTLYGTVLHCMYMVCTYTCVYVYHYAHVPMYHCMCIIVCVYVYAHGMCMHVSLYIIIK